MGESDVFGALMELAPVTQLTLNPWMTTELK